MWLVYHGVGGTVNHLVSGGGGEDGAVGRLDLRIPAVAHVFLGLLGCVVFPV